MSDAWSYENDPRFKPPAVAVDTADEIAEYISTQTSVVEEAARLAEQMLTIISEHLRKIDWNDYFGIKEELRERDRQHLEEVERLRAQTPSSSQDKEDE